MATFFRVLSYALLLFSVPFFPATLLAADPVEVTVTGVEGEALENVKAALVLPYGMVRDGKVDLLWLERFQQQAEGRVRLALEPFGYYHAQVATALEQAGKNAYRLAVNVTPGKPVIVTDFHLSLTGPGRGERGLRDRLEEFPLERGDVLLQQTYEEGKNSLRSVAREAGYLDADFSTHVIRIDKDANRAGIDLVLETGPRFYFGETKIEGGEEFPPEFLRRYIGYKAGDPFSYAKLGETQLNFTNSERFRVVTVIPEKEAAEQGRVPVTIELTEAPPRLLRPGVGYGTDTGARFTLRYRDLNTFDRGDEFNSHLFISERLQGVAMEYMIPDSRDVRSSTSGTLNLQQEDVTSYTSTLVAVELDRNRSFGRGELGTAYLRVQQEQFTVGAEESSSRLVLPGMRFVKNRYDNLIRPNRGYRFSFDVRGTHQYLGSSTGLLQLITEGSTMVPLPWRLSLSLRTKFGMTLQNDPLAELPATLRFFAGGDRSVRGYSYQSIGPKDSEGRVLGGKNLLVGSIELERHLYQNWGVSVFYDAGNAFNSFTNLTIFEGAGVGVHYYTRIGALSLSFARQLGVPSPAFRVHLTVGFEL